MPTDVITPEALRRDFEKMQKLPSFERLWVAGVCHYYNQLYDMSGLEPDVLWLKAVLPILQEFCPEQYKTGVHLLAKGVCFLGEDLWWVDGKPQHPIHFHHVTCKKHNILWRIADVAGAQATIGKSTLWCGYCQCAVNKEETKSDYED